jgi:ATP-dependent Zn protease
VETFKLYMEKVVMAAGVDAMTLAKATPGFTGAQIEAIVNSAAIMAAARGASAVDMYDMEEAMDKQWMGPALRSRKKTADMMRLTAFHEAGHTLAALYTKNAKELHKVTVLGRGDAGGVTHFFADDSAPANRTRLMADMDVAFGGLVAEELCNGYENVSTGPFSDLQQATEIARRYVKYFGMSKVGFSQYSQDHDGSEVYKGRVDEEVEALLQASYKRCKDLLQGHWHEVARLADSLVERETLTAEEVKVVIKGGTLLPIEEVLAAREAARVTERQDGAVAVPKRGSGAKSGGSPSGGGQGGGSCPP